MKDTSFTQISKSSATSASASKNRLALTKIQIYTFSLFDHLTQRVVIPSFIYYPFILLFAIQLISTSLWVNHSAFWENDETMNFFLQIPYLSPSGDSENTRLITFAIFTTIIMMTIIYIIGLIFVYKSMRNYPLWMLYVFRFLGELVALVMLHPMMRLMGSILLEIFRNENETIDVFFLIMLMLELVAEYVVFHETYSFINMSPYLGMSPLVAFDIRPFIKISMVFPIFLLADTISTFYPFWTHILIVVLHLLFAIYFKYISYGRHFISNLTNLIGDVVLGVIIIFDIINLVVSAIDNTHKGGVIFFSGITSLIYASIEITMYIYLTRKRKRYFRIKNPEAEVSYPLRDNRLEICQNLRLDIIERRAIYYFNFILSNQILSFLDFFYVKFLLEHFNTSVYIAIRSLKFISYFPPEYRLMKMISANLERTPRVPFHLRFLLFQIHKINTLRQSGTSADEEHRFKEMVAGSKEVFIQLNSFWTKSSCSLNALIGYDNMIQQMRARWEEIIEDFPNSSDQLKYYVSYLIDCCTDFKMSVMLTYKAHLIEGGRSFAKDYCFIYFNKNFESYLRKKIINLRGHFNKNDSSKASVSSDHSTSTAEFTDIDQQIEEGIGRELMTRARLRIALQGAINSKKPKISYVFLFHGIVTSCLSIFISLFIFIRFRNYFATRNYVAQRFELSNLIRFNYFSSLLNTLFVYGEETNTIDISSVIDPIRVFESGENSLFPVGLSWVDAAIVFNVDTRSNYTELMRRLSEISRDGSIYQTTEMLFSEAADLIYCVRGRPAPAVKVNMKTIIAYYAVSFSMLAISANYDQWFHDNMYACSLFSTASVIGYSFADLSYTMMASTEFEVTRSRNEIQTLLVMFPTIFYFVSIIIEVPILIFYRRELIKFASNLLSFDNTVKQEARCSLCKTSDIYSTKDEDQSCSTKERSPLLLSILSGCFFMLALGAVYLTHLLLCQTANNNVNNNLIWLMSSRTRKTDAIEACMWAHLLVLFGGGMKSNFTNEKEILKHCKEAIDRLLDTTRLLEDGNNVLPSVLGINDRVDFYEMSDQCMPDQSRTNFHEFYRCGSLSHLINFLNDMIVEVSVKNKEYNGMITGGIPGHLLEITTDHLAPLSLTTDMAIREIRFSVTNGWEATNIICFITEILLSVFMFMTMLHVMKLFNRGYDAVLTLLRKISPIIIVQNQELMNYLLNRSSTYSATKSTGQSIFNASADAIICTSITGMIETINQAVYSTLGYTPDQILGQMLEEIIDPADHEKINAQLGLMADGHASLTFEDHITCVNDTGMKVQCYLTLIGMTSSTSKNVESFTIILRDETDLIRQQEEAEQAKVKSELLLYQILPRDIVTRLNQGEKDITFIVQHATIMFIDIVKFSVYSAPLTPADIMEQLSSVFGMYDENMKKYPLLTKIKLIGDVYMCAGGLFSHDDSPSSHAIQMVKFGNDNLLGLDEFNLMRNTLLSVRTGINTGGPLIAGVLGTDKPTFDIIGDPINIASRLQSTAIPGQIQISQETQNLVADQEFDIQCRGEVMLKGKGNSVVYTIVPRKEQFILSAARSDEIKDNIF